MYSPLSVLGHRLGNSLLGGRQWLNVRALLGHFEMISAEHSSDNGKNKVTKKIPWHGNILNKVRTILSRPYL